MNFYKKATVILLICIIVFPLHGCKKNENQFNSINSICEYATLECYYHNVAKFEDPGKVFIVTYGNKKAWIEYSGTVKLGIDANRISVDVDGQNVTVTMPHAKVLSTYLDTDSINEAWIENGLFASINAEDRTKAVAEAQNNMEIATSEDSNLLMQSENRAKDMIEKYIKNVGMLSNKDYQVIWNMVD